MLPSGSHQVGRFKEKSRRRRLNKLHKHYGVGFTGLSVCLFKARLSSEARLWNWLLNELQTDQIRPGRGGAGRDRAGYRRRLQVKLTRPR